MGPGAASATRFRSSVIIVSQLAAVGRSAMSPVGARHAWRLRQTPRMARPSAFSKHYATLFPQIIAAKNRHNPFYEINPFRERRSSHADQTRDLRWFDCRPGFAEGAGAGQTIQCPEDQRTIHFIALQRPTAGARRNMDATSVSGTGLPKTTTAQIRDAKFGRTNALSERATREAFRFAEILDRLPPTTAVLKRSRRPTSCPRCRSTPRV
jgi:hypothetical protein